MEGTPWVSIRISENRYVSSPLDSQDVSIESMELGLQL